MANVADLPGISSLIRWTHHVMPVNLRCLTLSMVTSQETDHGTNREVYGASKQVDYTILPRRSNAGDLDIYFINSKI